MLTPEQVIAEWARVIEELQGEGGVRIMTEIGHNVDARITQRITEKGLAADGQGFQEKKPYNPMYLAYKKGEIDNPWTGEKKGSNRYKGYVDFQLTGEMWKSVQVTGGSPTANSVSISSLNGTNQEKLNKNAVRWNTDILLMSEEEQEKAAEQYINWAIKLFRNAGL